MTVFDIFLIANLRLGDFVCSIPCGLHPILGQQLLLCFIDLQRIEIEFPPEEIVNSRKAAL